MSTTTYPRLIFPSLSEDEMEYVLWQIEQKEWCGVSMLETSEGVGHFVSFVTPSRAASHFAYGAKYYLEEGLIIVPDTTLETMQNAVIVAWEQGFFNSLVLDTQYHYL